MSKTIATARMRRDGTPIEVLDDGTERPFATKSMRAMTEAEVEAAAAADPDARPMSAGEMKDARRVPRTSPLGTSHDWEQGRTQPISRSLRTIQKAFARR